MSERNMKRSEKRWRAALKAGVCLLALTGAYLGAPTVCDKIEAFRQEKATQERLQQEAEVAHEQEREKTIRYRADCDLIREIEAVEQAGTIRYFSAQRALVYLMNKDGENYQNDNMSAEEYQIRSNQLSRRFAQLNQIENRSLSKKGTHPLIGIILQERQPVKISEENAIFQHNIGKVHTR